MSETLQEKFGTKVPWVLGNSVRIPRIKFPEFRESSVSLPAPGRNILLIVVYAALFWLSAGGIYIYIQDPIAMGANSQGDPMWLYPSTHDAFIIESIVAALLIFLGGLGFVLMYNSTKHAFNYKYAIKVLIVSIALVAISFGLLQYMIDQKGG